MDNVGLDLVETLQQVCGLGGDRVFEPQGVAVVGRAHLLLYLAHLLIDAQAVLFFGARRDEQDSDHLWDLMPRRLSQQPLMIIDPGPQACNLATTGGITKTARAFALEGGLLVSCAALIV